MILLGLIDIFGKLSNAFGISISFECDTLLFKKSLDFLIVGDNTVVYDGEFVFGVGTVRMRIDLRRLTMGSPTSVSLNKINMIIVTPLVFDILIIFIHQNSTVNFLRYHRYSIAIATYHATVANE